VRERLRAVSWRAWLDAAGAALGVTSVSAAVIFDTVLRRTHGHFGVVATGLAHPLGDLVLLAILIAVGVVSGRRVLNRDWPLMASGFAVFWFTDSIYLIHSATNSYRLDATLDIGWPLSLVLIGLAAWVPFRKIPDRARPHSNIVVPAALSMLSLGVLVYDHFQRTNTLALVLATLCIVTVLIRLFLSFGDRQAAHLSALARAEAEEASDAKSLFIATVSHELRTPLNGVIGMTEMLLGTQLDRPQREYADIVRSSAESLLLIINDILDYSKFAAGKVNLVTTDFALGETIAEACAMLLVAARSKGIDLAVVNDPELSPWLQGDANRIRQVVVNLVANAVKFTEKGAVIVRVASTPVPAGTSVRVEVVDTGIGIDEQTLSRLFEPFTQADDSTSRRFGGTGLGLAISRQLVEAMGGTIGASSEPGQGSTFWFEITLAPARGDRPQTIGDGDAAPALDVGSRGAAPTDAPPLVLVAEDNPINQMVAVRLLEKCGYRADVVNDGQEAVEAVAHTEYAAVLMDCQMPVMDGYEATREIRLREYDDAHVPIIAMTAHSMDGAEEQCLAAGMDDYVTKPVRQQSLRAALARAIPEAANRPRPRKDDRSEEDWASGAGEDGRRAASLRELPREELRDLLALSFDHVASLVVLLVRAVQLNDTTTTATIAHSLKGASLSIGAQLVSAIAATLEADARAGDLSRASETLVSLQRAMAQDRAGSEPAGRNRRRSAQLS
jgi:signal transduction histidine kinase/CheY-like chemotaxis protein/HPt (histidine-containing phosphotransfer) domain-containing protein